MKRFYYFILGVLVLYCLACVSIYLSQESLIFPARIAPEFEYTKIVNEYPDSNFQFKTKDGIILNGWFKDFEPNQPLYIYYGGNAEDITFTYLSLVYTTKMSILSVNFRGYGKSLGKPSQKNLFNDALEIFDEFQKKYPARKICLIGRSLGSGVACYVASQRNIHAMLLITPYDSIRALAKNQYPLLPVNLIIKHPFDSINYASKITAPTMFLIAEYDFIIPNNRTNILFEKIKSQKEIFLIKGATHNSIFEEKETKDYVRKFVDNSKI